ncbi:PTS fructose transporter subunit IIA [Clostridium baratii]|uniref:PTS system fructose subfamily transporter subunit IIA n=1 Tax=Clostridium baratii TaxID=1561 RepID=A0A174UY06_9CLOT|nr:PTS sugar transporter subunit IIA [Clostridium baratii]OPF52162.1 PTS fructose transporter subunit IIA [Clostridium baratii]OPF55021.1 PTS fructose transporter subunit IIA [Clostridium baratii]OPF57240.1 PTS fructose transporter subunit IIA [Clostridium baratii]OPF61042.1 PTS fructose transporter subunit IIA [Clostridium baratii]CUQ26206.1 PTS system fructose subfamily transporter subunit IIA [Clostridium baratii]
MSNLILISHGRFAEELLKSVEMIVGPQENIHTVCLLPQEGENEFRSKLDTILNELEGDITIFADLFGGTPCNIVSKKILSGEKFDLYAGMNMPMIISYVNESLTGVKAEYVADGQNNVIYVNEKILSVLEDDED